MNRMPKRSRTRMLKYEGELRLVLRKYCLKLKIFEDFLDKLTPVYRENHCLIR